MELELKGSRMFEIGLTPRQEGEWFWRAEGRRKEVESRIDSIASHLKMEPHTDGDEGWRKSLALVMLGRTDSRTPSAVAG